jgi:hypothetical protein
LYFQCAPVATAMQGAFEAVVGVDAAALLATGSAIRAMASAMLAGRMVTEGLSSREGGRSIRT